jgi:Cys-rich four helix bundle protein (predicted Tat secretion target)
MNRRDALLSATSLAALSLGAVACNTAKADEAHAHHDHHGAPSPVEEAAFECVKRGQACLAHCIALLGSGDTSMAGCAAAVHDMLAAMEALAKLASSGSKRLAETAKVLVKLCEDCAAQCAPHADKHPTCKACHDACKNTIAAVAKLG